MFPGGGTQRSDKCKVKVCTVNCTAWQSTKLELENNTQLAEADILITQEHGLYQDGQINSAKTWLKNKGWRGAFEKAPSAGGVAPASRAAPY